MRIVFAGTPAFAARALTALRAAGHEIGLVLAQPARPAGRGLKPAPSVVQAMATQNAIPVFQPASLRTAEAVARIAEARPDVLVVAAYGLLLPPPVLEVAPRGALNIHASLLPRWRGAAPIQRALLAGDRETGITIMQMDAGLDTGPILMQRALAVEPDDDAQTLHDRLAELGAKLIVAALEALAKGLASPVPQPQEGACYGLKIGVHETVLDWSRGARELERAIRAFRPAPGSRTTLQGKPIKIWGARATEGEGEAGTVLQAGPEVLRIACGEGALEILELQRAGGRRLAVCEFLRGHPIRAGERLGAPR